MGPEVLQQALPTLSNEPGNARNGIAYGLESFWEALPNAKINL
jgi:hypothetical protein